jgi:hypothetical protein
LADIEEARELLLRTKLTKLVRFYPMLGWTPEAQAGLPQSIRPVYNVLREMRSTS